jgi:hypothetical protein
MPELIHDFRRAHAFLSNFYIYPFIYLTTEYPTAEHAWQAAQCADFVEKLSIVSAKTPLIAQRLGAKTRKKPQWEHEALETMQQIIEAKFQPGTSISQKLINTDDAIIAFHNRHRDRYLGIWQGKGANYLGRFLMIRRRQLLKGAK